MRHVHVICPKCKVKKTLKFDTTNLSTFIEKTVYIKCPPCKQLPDTPEERLMKAIFGEH